MGDSRVSDVLSSRSTSSQCRDSHKKSNESSWCGRKRRTLPNRREFEEQSRRTWLERWNEEGKTDEEHKVRGRDKMGRGRERKGGEKREEEREGIESELRKVRSTVSTNERIMMDRDRRWLSSGEGERCRSFEEQSVGSERFEPKQRSPTCRRLPTPLYCAQWLTIYLANESSREQGVLGDISILLQQQSTSFLRMSCKKLVMLSKATRKLFETGLPYHRLLTGTRQSE